MTVSGRSRGRILDSCRAVRLPDTSMRESSYGCGPRLVPHRGGARQPRLRHTHVVRPEPRPTRSCTARRTSTAWWPRSKRSSAGDHLFFTDWRGDPDERMRDGRPDGRRAVLPRRPQRGVVVKGLMWRSHLDTLAVQRGGEPPPRRGRSRRPAARCCWTSGCGGAARTTRRSSCCAIRTNREPRRRVRRRHRPVPQPARRRRPPRRPAGGADGPDVRRTPALARRAAGAARPGGAARST